MGPTGTPEVVITDGTIVPVKGANENGWNRLGGYTVMLESAYDAGPIEAGTSSTTLTRKRRAP
jgi:hypothetical protein